MLCALLSSLSTSLFFSIYLSFYHFHSLKFPCDTLSRIAHFIRTEIQTEIIHRARSRIVTSCNRRTISVCLALRRVDDHHDDATTPRLRKRHTRQEKEKKNMRVSRKGTHCCHTTRELVLHSEETRESVVCYALHFRFHCVRFEGVARGIVSRKQSRSITACNVRYESMGYTLHIAF